VRRRRLPLVAVLSLFLAAACGSSDDPEVVTQGNSVGDRYVRLFEVRDFGASLFVYNAALPPNLSQLLNPELIDTTPEEDIVSVPVPPEAVLLVSYAFVGRDGTIRRVAVPGVPDGLEFNWSGDRLYVIDVIGGGVAAIDVERGTLADVLDVGTATGALLLR
jgi:hypothetical protein